jgi:ribosome maturation factor RimP
METCGLRAAFFRKSGPPPTLTFRRGRSTPDHAGQTTTDSDLQELVESRLAALEPDVEVLLVERFGGRGSGGIRVYLDRPGGVDHELCVRATGSLRELLSDYSVEISSPGPARPLTKPDHYRRFVGHRVRVRVREAIEGRSEFKGELVEADDRAVALAGDWGRVTIPHERIRRSNLMPQAPTKKRRRP